MVSFRNKSKQLKSASSTRSTTTEGGSSKHYRKVNAGRLLFVMCLAGVAAILGIVTFFLLTESETTLAREQYESISDRALKHSLEIALRQKKGLTTLASMAEQSFPDAQTWPFVDFKGFEVISNNLIQTYSSDPSTAVGFLPIVTPAELDEFNAFASALVPDAPFDRVTGLDSDLNRYNETDGETDWGSPRKIFTPFLFHSRGPILFLANLHSLETRGGRDIDDMISCSEERAQEMRETANPANVTAKECSIVTDITDLSRNEVAVPAAVTYQTLYPANDPQVLVGFLSSAIKWEEVLHDVFNSEVSGIDCVLATETQVYTYHIDQGVATLK